MFHLFDLKMLFLISSTFTCRSRLKRNVTTALGVSTWIRWTSSWSPTVRTTQPFSLWPFDPDLKAQLLQTSNITSNFFFSTHLHFYQVICWLNSKKWVHPSYKQIKVAAMSKKEEQTRSQLIYFSVHFMYTNKNKSGHTVHCVLNYFI